MLEKKVRNKKSQLSVFNTIDKPGSDNEESYGLEKEDGNNKYSTLTREGEYKRSKKA